MNAVGLRRLTPTTWVTIQTVSEQSIGILLLAIQAAVLGPHAFGLFSLVMVFIGFCEFVLGMAAAEALISIRDIDDLHFHTMTTANVALAIVLGLAVFFGADAIAQFFDEPELAAVLRWMSGLPLISAFCAAPLAASKRDMQFRPIALRSIVGLAVGGSVGLALTLLGAGVWALVSQAIVQRTVSAIVLWAAVPLKPRFSISLQHFRDLQRFAATMMYSRSMNWASAQIPRLILGFYLGATDLGLFSLAARLSDMLFQVALEPRVSVSRLELRQFASDRIGLAAAMRKLFLHMSVFGFPVCIGAAAVVPLLFHAWLNPHWSKAIVLAQMLLLMGVPCITLYCTTAVLLAMNRQGWEAIVSTAQTSTTVLLVLLAAPFGLLAATAAIAVRPLLLFPLPVLTMQRICQIPIRVILGTQAPALAASLMMGVTIWLLESRIESMVGSIAGLFALVVIGALIYLGLIAALLPGFSSALFMQISRRIQSLRNLPELS